MSALASLHTVSAIWSFCTKNFKFLSDIYFLAAINGAKFQSCIPSSFGVVKINAGERMYVRTEKNSDS